VAHPRGFEPLAFAFGGQRSIQLSYGCVRSAATSFAASRQEQRHGHDPAIGSWLAAINPAVAEATRWRSTRVSRRGVPVTGNGFAIVANEVRALALRASEAAKEIGQLIGESGR
jgi:hypothetical protein